ncbi:GNAT family N-acetyltransferase [Aquimarina hainanensis]|uniref:GNAT family N-acetyltransferase n=1 Tax=Aquimarina hainanensis TaxID=1578017 RepID=A0ABW5N272_9FLAO|nr:GNAT family N-acetyltransferase [Aquimarina sp. TRL1]QKX04665.1 GNAT family N-acetyltransferase [Aquimarina sp. TRL1]
MKIHIETTRFILRDLEMTDAPGIFDLDSDPDVHEYLGKKPIQTIKEAEETILFIRNQYKENGIGRWAIIDKSTRDFIGWAGIKYEQTLRKGISYYDLGYRLRKKYWGKGIASETAKEAVKYGFEQLGVQEIFAAADIANIGSNKVLIKTGLSLIETFDLDGIPHNWYTIHKQTWDIHKNTAHP